MQYLESQTRSTGREDFPIRRGRHAGRVRLVYPVHEIDRVHLKFRWHGYHQMGRGGGVDIAAAGVFDTYLESVRHGDITQLAGVADSAYP